MTHVILSGTAQAEWIAVNVILTFFYAILLYFSLRQLFKLIRNNVPASWQKLFHLFLSTGLLLRIIYWLIALAYNVNENVSVNGQAMFFLNVLPSYIFFTVLLILLLCWVEIYHAGFSKAETTTMIHRFKPAFFIINAIFYTVFGILTILDFALERPAVDDPTQEKPTQIELVVLDLIAALYIVAAIAFLVYGISLYNKLETVGTQPALVRKVTRCTAVVAVTFAARAVMVVLAAYDILKYTWWLPLFYFLVLEYMALVLIFYILHDKSVLSRDRLDAERAPLVRSRVPPSRQTSRNVSVNVSAISN